MSEAMVGSHEQRFNVELRVKEHHDGSSRTVEAELVLLESTTGTVVATHHITHSWGDHALSLSPDGTAVAVTYHTGPSMMYENLCTTARALEIDENRQWRVVLEGFQESSGRSAAPIPTVNWSARGSASPFVSFRWPQPLAWGKKQPDIVQHAKRSPSPNLRIVDQKKVLSSDGSTEVEYLSDAEMKQLEDRIARHQRIAEEEQRVQIEAIKESTPDKELFDPRKFGKTARYGPVEQMDRLQEAAVFGYERRYYLSHPEFKTMHDFESYLEEMDGWGEN